MFLQHDIIHHMHSVINGVSRSASVGWYIDSTQWVRACQGKCRALLSSKQ